MNADFYPVIFKRRSFHLFRNTGSDKIEQSELTDIKEKYETFERLYPGISTAVRIVPAEKVNFKRDAEYCILIYSEKKENYLMNAGYIGEQLDLYLVSKNIGTLWFGIGKPDKETYEGLDFVIMIAIHKVNDESLYRKDMFKAKRKPLEDIWVGDKLHVAEIVRFAPSACNSQPWMVKNDGDILTVARCKKAGRVGIMPVRILADMNRLDMGIFLCILEICMAKQNIEYTRTLFADINDEEYTKVAQYRLINK